MNNEITCIYNKNKDIIELLHNYKIESEWNDEYKKIYNEAKKYMKDIYNKYIDIYINDKKIEFNTKYISNETGQIKVKFIFHKLLTNISFLFYGCSSLASIDLSSFNTTNVTNMSIMFSKCSSLKSVDLSSINIQKLLI